MMTTHIESIYKKPAEHPTHEQFAATIISQLEIVRRVKAYLLKNPGSTILLDGVTLDLLQQFNNKAIMHALKTKINDLFPHGMPSIALTSIEIQPDRSALLYTDDAQCYSMTKEQAHSVYQHGAMKLLYILNEIPIELKGSANYISKFAGDRYQNPSPGAKETTHIDHRNQITV